MVLDQKLDHFTVVLLEAAEERHRRHMPPWAWHVLQFQFSAPQTDTLCTKNRKTGATVCLCNCSGSVLVQVSRLLSWKAVTVTISPQSCSDQCMKPVRFRRPSLIGFTDEDILN